MVFIKEFIENQNTKVIGFIANLSRLKLGSN